jgi:hypothetical protein
MKIFWSKKQECFVDADDYEEEYGHIKNYLELIFRPREGALSTHFGIWYEDLPLLIKELQRIEEEIKIQ